ncbi:LCP family protein [Lysinibacillus capsici]|uniref:LCP family protein n=1 Tax=Lysinibacillus capsici TaxID=2115968 RepID=UPI00029CACED|nr:LCP family protein [Lysinibacillus capsici]EKU42388.1 cell envelope-related transcriptional attenuator [Lysinibacillus fusiformis ZB2]MED4701664.1 LCP family protein [Lysinibacillus capsici]
MNEKRSKTNFSNKLNQELQFTKEDRQKVFEQIKKIDRDSHMQKKSPIFLQKFAPVTVSILIIGLCLFLFLPSLLSGNLTKESNIRTTSNQVVEEEKVSTTLITVKSKEMDNRIYLNLLLTYNKDKKMMKVVSFPAETYAPVSTNNDGTPLYDKLLFAYKFGGADNVKTTVSKLVALPIDYYSVIDVETISTLIDSVNGLEYDLSEDIRVRAITQVAFEFEKGLQRFSGEEVIALLMAATEGVNLNEENLVNLLQAIINKMEVEMSPVQLKEMFTQMETNTSLDSLLENQLEIQSIKLVSLSNGMQTDSITLSETEGKFYYKFEKDFLNTISDNLTTFN